MNLPDPSAAILAAAEQWRLERGGSTLTREHVRAALLLELPALAVALEALDVDLDEFVAGPPPERIAPELKHRVIAGIQVLRVRGPISATARFFAAAGSTAEHPLVVDLSEVTEVSERAVFELELRAREGRLLLAAPSDQAAHDLLRGRVRASHDSPAIHVRLADALAAAGAPASAPDAFALRLGVGVSLVLAAFASERSGTNLLKILRTADPSAQALLRTWPDAALDAAVDAASADSSSWPTVAELRELIVSAEEEHAARLRAGRGARRHEPLDLSACQWGLIAGSALLIVVTSPFTKPPVWVQGFGSLERWLISILLGVLVGAGLAVAGELLRVPGWLLDLLDRRALRASARRAPRGARDASSRPASALS